MKEHLRFAVAYWHTFKGSGADIFGAPSYKRAWNTAFEFTSKLGAPYYCSHDRYIAPESATFAESCKNLKEIVGLAKKLQEDTGLKLLWGTTNAFSHSRFTHGAGSNLDSHTFAYAAAPS